MTAPLSDPFWDPLAAPPHGQSDPNRQREASVSPAYPVWARRRDVPGTVVLWVVLAVAVVWAASYVIRPALIVALAGLLAYAVAPAVRMLAHKLPLPLAIVLVYLALIGFVGGIGYLFVSNTITELSALANQITRLLTPVRQERPCP
jgi:predicted PurR-regulated permease PerM